VRSPLPATLILTLILPFAAGAKSLDWGTTHDLFVRAALNEKWSIYSSAQAVLWNDFSDVFFGYVDLGVGYKFHPAWRVEAAYRKAKVKPADDWLTEHRPLVNLTWFDTIEDIRLSNRSRIEFRDYSWTKKDDIRFRNRTRAELPWTVLPFGIKPYFEEEFFYGKNSARIEKNWLTGGLYYTAPKHAKLRLGYRWIAVRTSSEWHSINQIVTALVVSF
jgi:hypothetical protein